MLIGSGALASRSGLFLEYVAARCATQADVHDHMEYILTSLDMIAGITENLINYTFNVRHLAAFVHALRDELTWPQMASYEMNEVM